MVLRARYTTNERHPAFVTEMGHSIAELLSLDTENYRKYRRWLSDLQSGEITSLIGRR
ncbi:MAG: hypothetical protein R3C01_02235 [Planctomycetaceae bacterium]